MRQKLIIGIDEVGRGSLAGPVVVCAVALSQGTMRVARRTSLGALRDSKQLSKKQRDAWFLHLTKHPRIVYAVARVYPRGIDRLNISRAANLAAHRAYTRLMRRFERSNNSNPERIRVVLDGGLFLKSKERSMAMGAKTVIKGDEKIPAVAIASIIAKVTRDRYMEHLAVKYPHYGFDIHMGYGTALHRARLAKHGCSDVHRYSFGATRAVGVA